jgi:hypothetical protein
VRRITPSVNHSVIDSDNNRVLKLPGGHTATPWEPLKLTERHRDGGPRQPVWDHHARTFVDPDTRRPLRPWDEALEALADDEKARPARVVRFGEQVNSKGMLGGAEEAARHIGYLTKYLTKSISQVLEPDTAAQQAHHDRLHAELAITPCSERCPVWLRCGVVPKGASAKTVAGQCKGKANRRCTLGLPGRRVLVSRKWSGKTLPDHRADREEFVRQLLANAGIDKPERNRDNVLIYRVDSGDRNVPPRRTHHARRRPTHHLQNRIRQIASRTRTTRRTTNFRIRIGKSR